jgi:beta-alanine--pyruvate transaminase
MIALHDASNIAAVIVEPFSGSAGVVIPPKGYLQRLREICTAHNILLIFDEVITGFGRCGRLQRCRGLWRDARHGLNVAKQISNGAQPTGAVHGQQGDLRAPSRRRAVARTTCSNSPTATPTRHIPVACAAGLAALDVLVKERHEWRA